MSTDVLHRVIAKSTMLPSGCVVFSGAPSQEYGKIYADGRNRPVHVVMYELLVGPVPAGKELDHRCENKRCWNVAHLQALTRAEHIAVTQQRIGAYEVCQRGHVRIRGRNCRQCGRAAELAYRERKSASR